jgi:hypothetical protein
MNSEKNDRSYEGPRGLKASFIESSHVIATGLGAEGIEESKHPIQPLQYRDYTDCPYKVGLFTKR